MHWSLKNRCCKLETVAVLYRLVTVCDHSDQYLGPASELCNHVLFRDRLCILKVCKISYCCISLQICIRGRTLHELPLYHWSDFIKKPCFDPLPVALLKLLQYTFTNVIQMNIPLAFQLIETFYFLTVVKLLHWRTNSWNGFLQRQSKFNQYKWTKCHHSVSLNRVYIFCIVVSYNINRNWFRSKNWNISINRHYYDVYSTTKLLNNNHIKPWKQNMNMKKETLHSNNCIWKRLYWHWNKHKPRLQYVWFHL